MTVVPIYRPPMGGVLVASPSSTLCEQVLETFPNRLWPVQQVGGGAEALSKLESGEWQLLYLDRRLPDLDAEELMAIIQQRFPGIHVVLLDSDGSASADVSKREHRIPKTSAAAPAQPAVERSPQFSPLPGMIGDSEPMRQLYRLAHMVAPRPTTVLILVATGTSQELVARGIRQLSARKSHPFVVVNCAAIPETLLESELFGYSRAAFTGVVQSNAGRICAAQGGTLFLDEVGELPLSMQSKLLRFLEQPSFVRRILEGLRHLAGEQIAVASPVLLCSTPARFHLKRLMEPFVPKLVVLSPSEIPAVVAVQSLGTLR